MSENGSAEAKPTWGRYDGRDTLTTFLIVSIFIFAPLFTLYCYLTCSHFQCIIYAPFFAFLEMPFSDFWEIVPHPTWKALYIFVIWNVFQVFLFNCVPGKISTGQRTPAGNLLKYHINGLRVWIITHIVFLICIYFRLFPSTIIYDNWGSLLAISNIFGYLLATFSFVKAIYFPSHPGDVKFTGHLLYDFFMGAEMNPRIGDFDFKLFFNGRPGIIGWNLINLSFMMAQYHIHGEISNSMMLVTLLHMIYILDFFWNEEWYLCTIDIAHDHFGWYLAWGDYAWLPCIYTLQGHYLTVYPHHLAQSEMIIISIMGLSGYALFRAVNYQKSMFRKTPPGEKFMIWGKPATFVEAYYTTSDGQAHQSNLLTSGFWGMARHLNYLGDLCLSFAYCACCGFNHFLPYVYFLYMTVLLMYRVERDHGRLKEKYGAKWDEYCKVVRWKIIPFVY
jgi:7-dehydrocholesterol reductase